MSQEINVLALVKGNERYIFLYDDDSRADALRTLGRYASNPELSFSWYDAAVLSQKIRQNTPSTTNTVTQTPALQGMHTHKKPRRFEYPLPKKAEE